MKRLSYKSVISFSNDKVNLKYNKKNKEYYIIKKTTLNEFDNYLKFYFFFKNKIIINIRGKNYYLITPRILKIEILNENSICMYISYFKGENLEKILKNQRTHHKGVEFLNGVLKTLINNEIYWLDFAPRNISISEREICLFDFEKGFTKTSLKEFQFLIYEEYSAFLLINERILEEYSELEKSVDLKKIKLNSKRIEALSKYFNYNELNNHIFISILKKIIELETPIKLNGAIVYPILKLEYLLANYGYEFYSYYLYLNLRKEEKQ